MLEHCDFNEQVTSQVRERSAEARRRRPACRVEGMSWWTQRSLSRRFFEAIEATDEDVRKVQPDRARSPTAGPRRLALEEGLLAAVRRHTGVRDRVHPG